MDDLFSMPFFLHQGEQQRFQTFYFLFVCFVSQKMYVLFVQFVHSNKWKMWLLLSSLFIRSKKMFKYQAIFVAFVIFLNSSMDALVHLWATVLYVRKSKDGETARLYHKFGSAIVECSSLIFENSKSLQQQCMSISNFWAKIVRKQTKIFYFDDFFMIFLLLFFVIVS